MVNVIKSVGWQKERRKKHRKSEKNRWIGTDQNTIFTHSFTHTLFTHPSTHKHRALVPVADDGGQLPTGHLWCGR